MWTSMFADSIMDSPRECTDKINYRFINGRKKNKKHCYGYCNCNLHKGCLTSDMIKEHECIEKECPLLYIEATFEITNKRREDAKARKQINNKSEQIVEISNEAIEQEGIKVVSAVQNATGPWILHYVKIASIDLKAVMQEVKNQLGLEVVLQEKEVDFDRAVEIVYG